MKENSTVVGYGKVNRDGKTANKYDIIKPVTTVGDFSGKTGSPWKTHPMFHLRMSEGAVVFMYWLP